MKIGDELQTLAQIDDIFSAHPDVYRVQIERSAPGRYMITNMDDARPNDLKKIAKLNHLDYERHNQRGYEMLRSYHVPSDTMKYVFYRLYEPKGAG